MARNSQNFRHDANIVEAEVGTRSSKVQKRRLLISDRSLKVKLFEGIFKSAAGQECDTVKRKMANVAGQFERIIWTKSHNFGLSLNLTRYCMQLTTKHWSEHWSEVWLSEWYAEQ